MKYWLNTVSKDHVLTGKAGGFTQANHGSIENLRRLTRGDVMVFYSSGTHFRKGQLLQAFTAAGRVTDDAPFQVQMTPSFQPWRRAMVFLECEEAPIQPLIPTLDFITDKEHWGLPLRRGLFEISSEDFGRIAEAMKLSGRG